VLHGIRAFVPRMLRAGAEGHVVNTASMAGITSGPFISDYFVTKHAVLALSESLHHELTLTGAPVRVSALCPGFVSTRIMDADRNRPAEFAGDPRETRPELHLAEEGFRQLVNNSTITPQQVADAVLDAVRNERFYIFTHPEANAVATMRYQDITERRNPEWRLAEILSGGGAAGGAV
jgi:short-subunit dehydrogenase